MNRFTNMRDTQRAVLIQCLTTMLSDIEQHGPTRLTNSGFGICYNLNELATAQGVGGWAYDLVAYYSVDWPDRTGSAVRVMGEPGEEGEFNLWSLHPLGDEGGRVKWAGENLERRVDLMKYLRQRLMDERGITL